jgi:hypothetical protein
MLTSCQAGYWGSHLPIASSIDSFPAASSLRMTAAAKDLDALPVWNRVSWSIGPASALRPTLPAKASIAGPGSPKLTYAAMPVTFSIGARAASHFSRAA